MTTTALLPLFARKEATTDALRPSRQDVVLYHDKACTQLAARWPWHYSNKPTRRNKTVMFNCWKWMLVWQ